MAGRLQPTVTPAEDYLAIYLNTGGEKRIRLIRAGYIPATGGTVTTAALRIGRIKVYTGRVVPSPGSLNLDPFSPNNPDPLGANFCLVDQVIRNEILLPFGDEGLVIPSGQMATIIIGASVGEADSASAPSASYGYLTVSGIEIVKGNRLITNLNG